MPAWTVKTPPAALPVTTEEARDQLRIYGDGGKLTETVNRSIAAATQIVQREIDQVLVEQTLVAYYKGFPKDDGELTLPITPARDVVAVTYDDTSGAEQTLDADTYATDLVRQPGRIVLAPGMAWPSTRAVPNAVRVEYSAGYDTVPADIINAVLLLTGHLVENPQATSSIQLYEVPMAYDRILQQLRRPRLA